MTTDCPNCSCGVECAAGAGASAVCPFCGETFEIASTPFEQLSAWIRRFNPDSEQSPFFNKDYAAVMPCKNFTGWIIHRIREDSPGEVVRLLSVFLENRLAAAQVNTLWRYDFTPCIETTPEAYDELRALWLVSCLNRFPQDSAEALLFSSALWVHPVKMTAPCLENGLKKLKVLRKEGPLELRDEPVKEEDLFLVPPKENPLFEWAMQTPVAIRQRLTGALSYCGHGNSEEYAYGHTIQLDQATYYGDRLLGVDYGYATDALMQSNIFCEPVMEDFSKFFSKDELTVFLSGAGIPVKKSFTRKRMFDLFMNTPSGKDILREKLKGKHYVRLHPTLEGYAGELMDYQRKMFRFWQVASKITPLNL